MALHGSYVPIGPLRAFVEAYNNISVFDAVIIWTSINPVVGDSIVIDAMQQRLGTIVADSQKVVATSNSPSAFSALIHADALLGIEFSYEVEDATSGILSLAFDDAIIWEINIADQETRLSDKVYLSTEILLGDGELIWTYNSNEIGSTATFADFAIVTIAVPEPTSIGIATTLVLLFQIRRNANGTSNH